MHLTPFEMCGDGIGRGHQIKNVRRAFKTDQPFAFIARNFPAVQNALPQLAQAGVGVEFIRSVAHGRQGNHTKFLRKERGAAQCVKNPWTRKAAPTNPKARLTSQNRRRFVSAEMAATAMAT